MRVGDRVREGGLGGMGLGGGGNRIGMMTIHGGKEGGNRE